MKAKRGKYKKSGIKLNQLISQLEGVKFKTLEQLSLALGPQSKKQTRRMIAELEAMGYKVEKKPGKSDARRIFDKSKQGQPLFTFEEHIHTLEMLETAGAEKELMDKVSGLLATRIEETFMHFKKYNIIRAAIEKRRKLIIRNYKVRDRLAGNDKTCTIGHVDLERGKAYAWNSELSKFYTLNIENMGEVSISGQAAEEHPAWSQMEEETDLFGFSPTGKKLKVSLWLTSFATSMLIRQFPQAEPLLKPLRKNRFTSRFEATVFDIQPVARFVVGLFHEVYVEGDRVSKKAIMDYFQEKTIGGFNHNLLLDQRNVNQQPVQKKPKKERKISNQGSAIPGH